MSVQYCCGQYYASCRLDRCSVLYRFTIWSWPSRVAKRPLGHQASVQLSTPSSWTCRRYSVLHASSPQVAGFVGIYRYFCPLGSPRAIYFAVDTVTFFQTGSMPPLKTIKASFEVMGRHYPMRSGAILLVNGGGMIQWIWRVLEPLVDPRTREKVPLATWRGFFLPPQVAP